MEFVVFSHHATISDPLDIELIVGHGGIAIDVSHFNDQEEGEWLVNI